VPFGLPQIYPRVNRGGCTRIRNKEIRLRNGRSCSKFVYFVARRGVHDTYENRNRTRRGTRRQRIRHRIVIMHPHTHGIYCETKRAHAAHAEGYNESGQFRPAGDTHICCARDAFAVCITQCGGSRRFAVGRRPPRRRGARHTMVEADGMDARRILRRAGRIARTGENMCCCLRVHAVTGVRAPHTATLIAPRCRGAHGGLPPPKPRARTTCSDVWTRTRGHRIPPILILRSPWGLRWPNEIGQRSWRVRLGITMCIRTRRIAGIRDARVVQRRVVQVPGAYGAYDDPGRRGDFQSLNPPAPSRCTGPWVFFAMWKRLYWTFEYIYRPFWYCFWMPPRSTRNNIYWLYCVYFSIYIYILSQNALRDRVSNSEEGTTMCGSFSSYYRWVTTSCQNYELRPKTFIIEFVRRQYRRLSLLDIRLSIAPPHVKHFRFSP